MLKLNRKGEIMDKEKIKNYIYNKKPNIDNSTLEYFVNYFFVLSNNKQILGNNDIEKLIDNALLYASKIVFYDEKSKIYKELGPDCKGLRDQKNKVIYIRDNLEEPLREITIYHELHHAVQTNSINGEVGINQNLNIGRMIMEAQTQYFAEKVYEQVHKVKFEERVIPSEKLRMLEGGSVTSALHNYEMYDLILSKLAIMLDVSKDFFVAINYLYNDDEGLKKLKQVYDEAKDAYGFPYDFEEFLFKLDYVYCVDLLAYKDNADKEVVLSGKETKNNYEIYPGKAAKLSLSLQFNTLDDIDRKYFLCLLDAGADYKSFAKYILSNKTRDIGLQIVGTEIDDSGAKTK